MQKPIPKTTLLRFPLLFGGFLIASGVAFAYRRDIMGDIEQERNALYSNESLEDREMMEKAKREHQLRNK